MYKLNLVPELYTISYEGRLLYEGITDMDLICLPDIKVKFIHFAAASDVPIFSLKSMRRTTRISPKCDCIRWFLKTGYTLSVGALLHFQIEH